MAAADAWQFSRLVVAALYAYSPPRYTGPLEYLTMWMCLFLSPAVLERLRDLQAQEPDWTRLRGIRVKLSAAQAIHPHVLDVLQHMGSAPNDAACPILPLMQKAT